MQEERLSGDKAANSSRECFLESLCDKDAEKRYGDIVRRTLLYTVGLGIWVQLTLIRIRPSRKNPDPAVKIPDTDPTFKKLEPDPT